MAKRPMKRCLALLSSDKWELKPLWCAIPYPPEWVNEKGDKARCQWGCRTTRYSHILLVRLGSGPDALEDPQAVFYKANNTAVLLPGCLLKRNENIHKKIYIQMVIAALFIIENKF